jgi:cytochrome c2
MCEKLWTLPKGARQCSSNAQFVTRSVRAQRTASDLNSTALNCRHSGSVPNYSYSDANKNSGIVWNEKTFEDYIKDPRAKIPGTKMIFAGIKNEQQAKDLWAYLKQFDDSRQH